jgi:hypothetical protein
LKKFFLFGLTLLFSCAAFAQNGYTEYSKPQGVTGTLSPAYMLTNALVIGKQHEKWVAFRSNGVAKFNGLSWVVYNSTNSILPASAVLALSVDASNTLWMASNSGVFTFDGTLWKTYNTSNSAIPSNKVNSIFCAGGKVYGGTNNGFFVFDGSTWTTYAKRNSPLLCDTVNHIAADANGVIWAATLKGISRLQGVAWSHFTSSNSVLSGNVATALFVDVNNDAWVDVAAPYNGNTLFRIAGYNVIPANAIAFPSALAVASFPVTAICEGPHGGIAYNTSANGQLGGIREISPSANYMYTGHLPTSLAYEASTGLLWFLERYQIDSSRGPLWSFDFSKYSSAWQGVNYTNCKNLDINEVNAMILGRGDMHWDGVSAHYEVPKGSGKSADFAASLWIGGMDQAGTLHQAAMTYRQHGYDYWPGPLDTIAGTTDSTKAGAYDKLWKIDRFKVEEFKHFFGTGDVQAGTYTPEADILSWPAQGNGNFTRAMAPFVDVNHNGIYDPLTGGDYPEIKGDQMVYRIFNDNLGFHSETGGAPLLVEVHASSYAYTCPSIADSDKVLNYTTFYHYEVFNRSRTNYKQVYFGSWQDVDLGNYSDDYVGCDPEGNYGFVYNGALCDVGSGYPNLEYGCKPPMMSTIILDGPLAVPGDGIDNNNNGVVDEPGEKNLMTAFHYYNNDFSTTGNPGTFNNSIPPPLQNRPMDYYNYLMGKWRDSTFITYGVNGYGGTTPTRFMYSSVPSDTAGWSEPTVHNTPGDRRFLMSCGPFNFDAGTKLNFDYAIVFTRDTNLAPHSQAFYTKNYFDTEKVKSWWEQNNAPSCLQLNVSVPELRMDSRDWSLFPNPCSDMLNISYAGKSALHIELFDISGKLLLARQQPASSAFTVPVTTLASGLYFIRIQDEAGISFQKFVKQ